MRVVPHVDVLVGGGELHVLLFVHLDLSSKFLHAFKIFDLQNNLIGIF